MILKLIISLLITGNLLSCNKQNNEEIGDENPIKNYLEITLQPSQVNQTIHSFGASDAWSTQFVGKNWPLNKKNQIADLLFSQQIESNGKPKGIGLTSWRFNVGAGSSSLTNDNGISDEWRRAESFLTSNGYNWDAHVGQRWFLKAAKARGVLEFTAFSNSPPIVMTRNGKAYSSGGSSSNLAATNYDKFAGFLTTVIENIKLKDGIDFNYVSPFNEPQWDWTGGQEGTPWLNSEIAEITRILDTKIKEKGLNTKIEIAEAGNLNFLYEDGNKVGRGSQIEDFFSISSSNYIGNLTTLSKKICGHSYYSTYGTSTLIDTREKVKNKINSTDPNLEFWMTEYCLLENNAEIKGNGRDLGIDPALYLARVIYSDLVVGNASSWQWWLAVSPYDYKDGLVYIDNNKSDGNVYDSKLLWALGNYSFFIKNGYQRINLKRSDNKSTQQSINDLLVSAYKNPEGSKFVLVFVNQKNNVVPVKLKVDGKNTFISKLFETSSAPLDNLAPKGTITEKDLFHISPKSILTVVIE